MLVSGLDNFRASRARGFTVQGIKSRHRKKAEKMQVGDRVLYYIHHEDYPYEDVFWHSGEGGMTVFGFGRGPSQDNWQQLTKAPAKLTLGFAEKNDFPYVRERVNNAYKSLKISVGSLRQNR